MCVCYLLTPCLVAEVIPPYTATMTYSTLNLYSRGINPRSFVRSADNSPALPRKSNVYTFMASAVALFYSYSLV